MANLIAYYSRAGENYWAGGMKTLAKGNTARVAEYIQQAVGGDLFELETVRAYDPAYMACIEEAKAELRENARPELKALPRSLDSYGTVFLGYPNWWGTCPMCVFTFLQSFDFAGKRIIPFCTNEGSGMGRSERDIAAACPGATVERGLSVLGHESEGAQATVAAWAKRFA